MTCLERVMKDQPCRTAAHIIESDCPQEYFSIEQPDYCKSEGDMEACRKCWNREISVIKDSGDRTQFESGAVRDMHGEDKGRFDLLPMCAIMRLARHFAAGCEKYGPRNWEKGIPCSSFADSAMRHIFKYMDGWKDEDHLIAAVWNLCCLAWNEEKRPDLMDIPARLEASNE